ncbi:SRPBCC family protein [Hydrogenophaga sp. 2FB]|uniref:SRPBCC family protein n=1 Tax=Hydrogenophaga sp. 2FB TaxID=2502187 RepID=UPI0010F9AD06|nr:SRPBCC family protein [Hydrogenophaga sp. 2FB]
MIKTLALLIGAVIAVLLIYAATRPDAFHVERSTTIQAPPERLHPLINDLQRFNTWNPYNRKDPQMQGRYSGASAGPGAVYDFEGNKDVGKGRISVTATSAPSNVVMRLDMFEPFAGSNVVTFSLVPEGGATRVTWAMDGPSPFIARLIGVFMNMDQMIGRDFEAGLANLKALAEKPPAS